MKVVSINTAKPESLKVGTKLVTTGIFKKPRNEPVAVNQLGFEGDTIVNKKVHGGIDQAVYIYSETDYQWWRNQLGRDLEHGKFGENLTITDFHDKELRIGDRLILNESVVLEITAPRVPCAQFATKVGDAEFGKHFVKAVRPGAYARVLTPGLIEPGCSITWQTTEQDFATVNEVFIEWHKKSWSESIARKALNSPISNIAREIIEKRSGVKI